MQFTLFLTYLFPFLHVAIATPIADAKPEDIAKASELQVRHTTWNGVATYYTQDGVAGSCGDYHSDSDMIVAISEQSPFTYNAHCGQWVTITNMGGGEDNYGQGTKVTAQVADTCPGCENSHLDLSVGVFQALTGGPLDPPGEFNIQWHLN